MLERGGKRHTWLPAWLSGGPLLLPPLPPPPPRVPFALAGRLRDRSPGADGPLCSCPAVRAPPSLPQPFRPPLSLMPRLVRGAVWQHKTNNATTQPSLLLTEMQPTALFRPLPHRSVRPNHVRASFKPPFKPTECWLLSFELFFSSLVYQTFWRRFAKGWTLTLRELRPPAKQQL